MGHDAFWIAVYCVGVAQGLFLSLALALKPTVNRGATRTLAALAAAITVAVLGGLVKMTLPAILPIVFLNVNTELACGPLLFLFICFVVEPDRTWQRRDAVHFLPLAVSLCVWLGFYGVLRADVLDLTEDQFQTIMAVFVTFKASFLYGYLALAYRTLGRGLRAVKGFADGRKEVELGWLKSWILVFAGLATLSYLSFYLGFLGFDPFLHSDELASLVGAVTIYLMSLTVLLRPWLLSARPRLRDDDRFAGEAARLKAYLETKEPYLEPALTLLELAQAVGLSENRLSAVINDGLDTSFYVLLNRCRLEHFEKLAGDANQRRRSVLDLAFDAGFNSKASFYRVFREAHDTTPSAYRKALLG